MPARDLPEFWDISYDEELTQFLYTEGFDRNRPREAAAAFLAAWQGDEFKTLLQQVLSVSLYLPESTCACLCF